MESFPENEKTKEAFKILERYCQKRYEKAQNFLLGTANSENFLGINSVKSLLTPITTSRFSFQPELKRQQSIISDAPFGDTELPTDDVGKELEQECLIERESIRSYLWRLTKILYDKGFKHLLIITLVIAYTLLGALMFYYLEAEHEDYLRGIHKNKIEQGQKVANLAINRLFIYESCIIGNSSSDFKLSISEMCNERVGKILEELSHFIQMNANGSPKDQWEWDYWNAVFYALSISTTIGYGNLACKTVKGRVATIIYGLFGIPLMLILLNSIGHLMFSSVEVLWKQAKRKLKRKTRRVRKHIMAGIKSDDKLIVENGQQIRQNTEATILEETSEEDRDLFETFPVYLAVIILFVYVLLCSIIVCFWETWDYFTAFYFFFISITTIGFGDEMPEHPKYSICFFIFFIVGLSLGSMCVAIIQQRVENKYMQALQLIDEQQQLVAQDALSNSLPQVIVGTPDQHLSPDDIDPMLKANLRWRHPSALEDVMANYNQGQLNSVSECLSPAEYYASPILSALIKRRHGSQRNLMRSFSRSVTTTANVSLDIETPQTPVKQHSIDFLDSSNTTNTKKIRPKHLWKDESNSFKTSVNSLHVPLSIIVESKNDESIPPLAEQDTDSEGLSQ